MRLSFFILSLLLIGLFTSVMAGLIIDVGNNYGKSDTNNINISSYNKLEELSEQVEASKANITAVSSESAGFFDIFGKMFSGGVSAARTTAKSFEVGLEIADEAFTGVNQTGGVPLGSSGENIKTFIIAALTVVLFVAIILAIIVKWRT